MTAGTMSMRWGASATCGQVDPLRVQAERIVGWVNANDGQARYEPGMPTDPLPSGFEVKQTEPRIAVRTVDGWAFAVLGQDVVMGDATFDVARPEQVDAWMVRDFHPRVPGVSS